MKYLFAILLSFMHMHNTSANHQYMNTEQIEDFTNHIDALRETLNTSNDTYIIVVAHRGDWTHAPKNSLQAIKDA